MKYSPVCPWNRYKVELKYISPYSGRVIDEIEVEVAANAQEAVAVIIPICKMFVLIVYMLKLPLGMSPTIGIKE